MGTVTAFARTLASAVGLRLDEEGNLFRGDALVRQLSPTGGRVTDAVYFELIDWVRLNHPDQVGVAIAYAHTVDIDKVGALGLAMKTAPTLRETVQRVERYFRLLTDTASYHLNETADPCLFDMVRKTGDHPALQLRNECALAAFGRLFRDIVGPALSYDHVSFQHAGPAAADTRFERLFGCPVRFGAARNAIAIAPFMLDLPTRLGDAAVSHFLVAHLDSELGALATDDRFEHVLARHLAEALSNGIPRAGSVARAIGMSERTLRRRLAETGLTYQAVLESTQQSLAESLLRQHSFSITDVAFLTGFSEQSSFNRAFKRWVGQTPGTYRSRALNLT